MGEDGAGGGDDSFLAAGATWSSSREAGEGPLSQIYSSLCRTPVQLDEMQMREYRAYRDEIRQHDWCQLISLLDTKMYCEA